MNISIHILNAIIFKNIKVSGFKISKKLKVEGAHQILVHLDVSIQLWNYELVFRWLQFKCLGGLVIGCWKDTSASPCAHTKLVTLA
jgi:hypothetical protein